MAFSLSFGLVWLGSGTIQVFQWAQIQPLARLLFNPNQQVVASGPLGEFCISNGPIKTLINGRECIVFSHPCLPHHPDRRSDTLRLVLSVALPNPSVTGPLAHDARGQPSGLQGRPFRRRASQGGGGEAGAGARVRVVGDDVVYGVGLLQKLRLGGDELEGAERCRFGNEGVAEVGDRVDSDEFGCGESGVGGAKLPERPESIQFDAGEAPPGVSSIGGVEGSGGDGEERGGGGRITERLS